MSAASLDLFVEQGAAYRLSMTWRDSAGTPVDLTGYTARFGLRHEYGDAAAALLLTELSGITLGGAAGTIIVNVTGVQTGALAFDRYHYDLTLTSAGVPSRLLQGEVHVAPSSSR